MGKILVVDADASTQSTIHQLIDEDGHSLVVAGSREEALARCLEVDAVISNLVSWGASHELIHAVHEQDPTLQVIVLADESEAHSSSKVGALECVSKPLAQLELRTAVVRALEARASQLEDRRIKTERALGHPVVGDSPVMRRLLACVERVACRDVTVLLRGETGTGKEVIASLLHAGSTRASQPLIRVNCAAFTPDLAESQLFGHVKGAFTGAAGDHRGFFAEADGGTLVLDEVGELGASVQAALLRTLQNGEIQPVGASRTRSVDVRIIASTNRHLLDDVRAGRFREDLYYRLAVVELVVPPLRDRRVDIPSLAVEFARRCATRFGLEDIQLTPEFLLRLTTCEWPGNVRQLENTIARLLALSSGDFVHDQLLDLEQAINPVSVPCPTVSVPSCDEQHGRSLHEQVRAFERRIIAGAFEAAHGNRSEAARRLSVSRTTLLEKLKKYGLC
jgi:two-component system, NtrC family, response regulator AtoC